MALCDGRRQHAAMGGPAALPDWLAVESAPFALASERGLARNRSLSDWQDTWQKTGDGSLCAGSAIVIHVPLCAGRQR